MELFWLTMWMQGCSMLGGGIVTLLARGLHDKNLKAKW